MNNPLVSVIIPTFNRAATLSRTVDSALAQTYQGIEVIVVDDGSVDTTWEVLGSYGDRIRVIRQENGGPSSARNTGARAAKGEWLAFLDSDDVWKSEKIARQVRLVVNSCGRVSCCMCNANIINGEEDVNTTSFDVARVRGCLSEGYWLNPAPLLATRFILFNQVALISRVNFLRVGGFNSELRVLEDYDLAFRLARSGGPWAFVDDPLVDKYNDTGGIGVVAMADPLVHSAAWRGVIEGFLDDGDGGRVDGLLRRALKEVCVEISLLEMRRSPGFFRNLAGFALFSLRMLKGLRRKLPDWPRPVECDILPPASLRIKDHSQI